MLKKTITYTDFNGTERTEDFYFNLTDAEVTEMELSHTGGMTTMIEKIVAEQNMPAIIELFKTIICKSYGEKSLDGKRFMKSDEILRAFTETEAYSQLFMELASDSDKASEFVNGIISENARRKVAENPDSKKVLTAAKPAIPESTNE